MRMREGGIRGARLAEVRILRMEKIERFWDGIIRGDRVTEVYRQVPYNRGCDDESTRNFMMEVETIYLPKSMSN